MNDCCYHCGGKHIEKRKVEYLYSLQGKHLLVPDMPAELCLDCGTLYYPGWALEEVERRFLLSSPMPLSPIASFVFLKPGWVRREQLPSIAGRTSNRCGNRVLTRFFARRRGG